MADSTEHPLAAPNSDDLLLTTTSVVRRLLRATRWTGEIDEVLAQFGSSVNASRVCLCQLQSLPTGEQVFTFRAEWSASAVTPKFQHLDSECYFPVTDDQESLMERLRLGEQISGSIEDFPPSINSTLEPFEIRSVLVAPVFTSREWWGCLVVEECREERQWTETERHAVDLVADAIGTAMEWESVEHQRRRLDAILANSDDAIIEKTMDGTITAWNAGAERLYGYTADEALGRGITLIFPPDRQDEFNSIMDRLRAGEHVENYETIRMRKDGRELAISVSITPIYDQWGRITGAVSIGRDITERREAERLIQASEERLRLALEAGNIGAWDWYLHTDEVVWSPNMERLHGLDSGTFGGTFEEFKRSVHPEDAAQVLEAIHRAVEEPEEYKIEYRSLLPNGDAVWLSAQGKVIRDDRGRPIRMTGVCQDITERKRIEELQTEWMYQLESAHAEADAERARLQELFQHAPAMMALLQGPDHTFTLANDHYRQAVGQRDVMDKPVIEALPEVKGQGFIELLDHVYQTGETIVRSELPMQLDVRGEGTLEERFFSFAYQPSRDQIGQVTGVLVHAVDMTDQVRARQRVEELAAAMEGERDRLQQIVDVLPEGMAICDTQGQIILSNLAAREIWGQAPPERGGIDQYGMFGSFYEDGTPYEVDELPLSRSVLRGDTVLGEQLLIRNAQTGEKIPVLVNSVPLRDSVGTILGGVAVFQDIGPLKEFEQQKDEFLQTVSHDLKNPLTTIQGYVQLLQRMSPSDPERFLAASENMETAAKRAIAMLDEILDLTRFQMGRPLELALEEVDLVALATRLAEQHQAMAETHEVVVTSDVHQLVAVCDEVRMERVVANLLTNAIGYSPDGGRVELRIRREEDAQTGVAVVSVQDEGIGIPAAELPRLFERFWRGSNVRRRFRGTGLGLPGAKAIVEAHGGEIHVQSVEGEGSTFTIRLPLNPTRSTEGD